jgi:1-acyl-sn-glycerol-3-phosphate acyltransferase
MVGGMVRRSVRRRFRALYWNPPKRPIQAPAILVCNHHGWFDGYLMYLVAERLGLPMVMWVEEYDAFPLFGKAGALPFPADDAARRAGSILRSIRLMRGAARSLVLFPEGELHLAPDVLPFGRALELVASKVPEATLLPVAIRYEMGLHERPEAYVALGAPVGAGDRLCDRANEAVAATLAGLTRRIHEDPESFERLMAGTADVNERWDVRKSPFGKRKGR